MYKHLLLEIHILFHYFMKFDELSLLGLIVIMGLRSFIHRLTTPAYQIGQGPAGPMKLACVVNQELKMGKGKIAAQVGHASVKAILDLGKSNPAALEAYLAKGQKKICLKVPTAQDLKSLKKECKEAGVACSAIHDAGHTQIPAGSFTVLAIGPAEDDVIDSIVSHLKLL